MDKHQNQKAAGRETRPDGNINAYLSSGRGETDRASDEYLEINNCGSQFVRGTDMTTIRRQGRKDYQLLYIWKGCGYFLPPAAYSDGLHISGHKRISQEMLMIGEGEIVIYHPGQPQIYTYRANDHAEAYWVHMTGSGVAGLLSAAGFAGDFRFHIGQHPDLPLLFQKIIREIQRQQEKGEWVCQAGFLELLALMGRYHSRREGRAAVCNREQLLAVIDTMHNRYREDLTNEDFANACNLSVYRFIHLFRQLTGLSPYAYQTRIRIDRARDLLLSTTLNIAEVAAMVGYGNPLYFSRLFHKHTGLSPTAFKKNG